VAGYLAGQTIPTCGAGLSANRGRVYRGSMAGRAVIVTPLSGPLARFGVPGAAALELWAEQSGVALEVLDSQPSTAAAISAAEAGQPDVVFGPYGSGPAVVAAQTGALPLWNHGGATNRLTWPRYPHVVNVPSAAYSYLGAVLETLVGKGLPAGSQVALLHADTGFGREVAAGTRAAAQRHGLVLQNITFRPGAVTDVLTQVAAADVLVSAGSFDDDVTVAQWSTQRRWLAVGLVAAGVDELSDVLGERVEGFYGPCQWLHDDAHAATDGPDAEWFVRRYRDKTGTNPPYPAAAAFAAGVIWRRCVLDAGTIAAAPVLAATRGLDTTTLFGRFRVDPLTGVQTGHQIRVVQWRGGRRVAVDQALHRM